MKIFNKICISLVCLFNLVGCTSNKDGLDNYRNNGQLIDINYKGFDRMLTDDESFVFLLKRDGCHACEMSYSIVSEFLDENKDKKLYMLNVSEMEPMDSFTLLSHLKDFYLEGVQDDTSIYTPTIVKIVDGNFLDIKIWSFDKEDLERMYQDNYRSMDTYFEYNIKVQRNETFNIFVSRAEDEQYDCLLRDYFINNSDLEGYYLDTTKFDESQNQRMLNRINYYLGKGNEISEVPTNYMLQYENGSLVNYVAIKHTVDSLNSLYSK